MTVFLLEGCLKVAVDMVSICLQQKKETISCVLIRNYKFNNIGK